MKEKAAYRKESFFAIWKSGVKISRAIAFVIIGIVLQFWNLNVSDTDVTKGTEWAIIILFGSVVGICFIISGYLIAQCKTPEISRNVEN